MSSTCHLIDYASSGCPVLTPSSISGLLQVCIPVEILLPVQNFVMREVHFKTTPAILFCRDFIFIRLQIDTHTHTAPGGDAVPVCGRDFSAVLASKSHPHAAAKSLQSCPTLQPHRRQPTRLSHPWDSPGKNTAVGCRFLLQCMQVKSESAVPQSCLTPSDPMDYSLPGSSVHGIFQARVLEWGAIATSS